MFTLEGFLKRLYCKVFGNSRDFEKYFGYFGRRILTQMDGNDQIANLLRAPRPAAVGKVGSVELFALGHFLKDSTLKEIILADRIWRELYVNAGVFPPHPDTFKAFCLEYLDALTNFDILAVWYNEGEAKLIKSYAPRNVTLTELRALGPFYNPNPWSEYLAGKKVLVVSPFADSITRQYQRREKLWRDPRCLPAFELETFKVPLSDALTKSPFPSWSEGLAYLKESMGQRVFDVAIIGCGAWSVPLVAHIKKLGKIGIHLGGTHQLLFGIKGERWDNREIGIASYNEFWVRPSGEEAPPNVKIVERGCYW